MKAPWQCNSAITRSAAQLQSWWTTGLSFVVGATALRPTATEWCDENGVTRVKMGRLGTGVYGVAVFDERGSEHGYLYTAEGGPRAGLVLNRNELVTAAIEAGHEVDDVAPIAHLSICSADGEPVIRVREHAGELTVCHGAS